MAALHPFRREILSLLSEPAGAATLARRLRLPRQRLNYHLRALERVDLIKCCGTRKVRGCTERLLQRNSRRLLLHPFLLEPGASKPSTRIDPRSWTYLRSRVLRLLRDVSLAEDNASRRPLALETTVGFKDEEAREKFEQGLRDAFRKLADRFGHGTQSAQYLLLGLPTDDNNGNMKR